MKRLVLLALACFAAVGCKKHQEDPAPSNSGNQGGGVEGAIIAPMRAANREELENVLHQIQIYIENASVDGTMPSPETIYATLQREAPKYAKFIADQKVVLNPAKSREEVWAWAVLPQGNYSVLTASGIERKNLQELNALLGR